MVNTSDSQNSRKYRTEYIQQAQKSVVLRRLSFFAVFSAQDEERQWNIRDYRFFSRTGRDVTEFPSQERIVSQQSSHQNVRGQSEQCQLQVDSPSVRKSHHNQSCVVRRHHHAIGSCSAFSGFHFLLTGIYSSTTCRYRLIA